MEDAQLLENHIYSIKSQEFEFLPALSQLTTRPFFSTFQNQKYFFSGVSGFSCEFPLEQGPWDPSNDNQISNCGLKQSKCLKVVLSDGPIDLPLSFQIHQDYFCELFQCLFDFNLELLTWFYIFNCLLKPARCRRFELSWSVINAFSCYYYELIKTCSTWVARDTVTIYNRANFVLKFLSLLIHKYFLIIWSMRRKLYGAPGIGWDFSVQ